MGIESSISELRSGLESGGISAEQILAIFCVFHELHKEFLDFWKNGRE